MSNIKKDFLKQESKNANLTDLINFTNVIIGKKYPLLIITRSFNELVDKNDYAENDKEELFKELFRMTNLSQKTLEK